MNDALLHRGPDDGGVWVDKRVGVALGHRRLSILDLTPAGHQPMHSECGRYVLVFNGEIYNHLEIRTHLEKESLQFAASNHQSRGWNGHSDTETLLAAFAAWGVEKTLQACVGMFAIALWDKKEQVLTLARDRMGEKPLYYGWVQGAFVFGSELKAIKQYSDFNNPVSRDVLSLYLRHCYVPAPYSIYQDIYKLEPGCLITIKPDAAMSVPVAAPRAPFINETIKLSHYWRLHDQVEAGQASLIHNEYEALGLLESRLNDSIRLQSISDVPLGAFLSGGIDSSLIVALMQKQSVRPVKTFTIGFQEQAHNEAEHAKAVSSHLHTEHTELYVAPQDALSVIPRLSALYDEPFADSSQIPTFLVAQLARQHVTVSLSGDAGDELFGGYNRYFWGPKIWSKFSWMPFTMRQQLGNAMTAASRSWIVHDRVMGLLPRKFQVTLPADKLKKMGEPLQSSDSIDDLYYSLVSAWNAPEDIVIGSHESPTLLTKPEDWPDIGSPEHRMMYLDSMSYLPDDILCKVDRAAMGSSLETRVPFLDHRVVELAWRVPLEMKIRHGQGKWLLREILYRYVPKELIERPKQGFGIPLAEWLRGPLRDWAEALLDESRLEDEGYFRPAMIRRKWDEHCSGTYNWHTQLWNVLMFQAWLEENQ